LLVKPKSYITLADIFRTPLRIRGNNVLENVPTKTKIIGPRPPKAFTKLSTILIKSVIDLVKPITVSSLNRLSNRRPFASSNYFLTPATLLANFAFCLLI
jgi:hypothetical protein